MEGGEEKAMEREGDGREGEGERRGKGAWFMAGQTRVITIKRGCYLRTYSIVRLGSLGLPWESTFM